MFYEQRTEVPSTSEQLLEEYLSNFRNILTDTEVEHVIETSTISRQQIEMLLSESNPEFTLSEAAAVSALNDESLDAETIAALACDNLLLGMTIAVIDVDVLASESESSLDATEIQQKIEQRQEMTFDEYVEFQYIITSRSMT